MKFFKNIRKKLLNQNRFRKYLLYAIGEIVLVVIGILIALSINNWNNEKKALQAEIKYLNQIKTSLQENHKVLQNFIDHRGPLLTNGEKLLDHLRNKEKLNDTIKEYFTIPLYDASTQLNTGAFENLKNEGLSIISNDSLKLKIVNMYDQNLKFLHTTLPYQMENNIAIVVNPFYNKHFELKRKGTKVFMEPNDYDQLLKNQEIKNIISHTNVLLSFAIYYYKIEQKKIGDLIVDINTELNKLEKL